MTDKTINLNNPDELESIIEHFRSQGLGDAGAALRALLGHEGPALSHDDIRPHFGPPCMVPGYVEGEIGGGWKLAKNNVPMVRGYFSSLVPCPENPVLSHNGTVFMSVTPMELESHWVPLTDANGYVVIAGLGMAMIVLNLLQRQMVEGIVVLEHSRELIDAFPDMLEGFSRELWETAIEDGVLAVIEADCRGELPLEDIAQAFGHDRLEPGLIDHLYADIWPTLHSKDALPDTQNMVRQLKPQHCSFWGQELELASVIGKPEGEVATPEEIREATKKLDLPLSLLNWEEEKLAFYGKMIGAAVYASVMR